MKNQLIFTAALRIACIAGCDSRRSVVTLLDLAPDLGDLADGLQPVLAVNVVGDRSRRGEGAGAALAEGFHQGAVVQLGDDRGLHPLRFEPLQQRAAVGDILARQQERGAVERGPESPPPGVPRVQMQRIR